MDRGTEPAAEHTGEPSGATGVERDDQHVHPLDEERAEPPRRDVEAEVVHRRRGLGANRHLGSVVLCFVAVLAAYGALDFGFERARAAAQDLDTKTLPDSTIIALGVAAACLLLAGATGRISGLGPLLAGLVLGAAPAAWVSLDFASYVRRLDDVPELWDRTTFGLSYAGFAVYPAVAGLLLGAAIAGRWRRHPG